MASRFFNRNVLSLDDKLVLIEAAIKFNANGAPVLQQWVPSSISPTGRGFYQDAPIGGCEGIAEIRKRTTGDFEIVLQDGYQRVKEVATTWRNSAHLAQVAPFVQPAFGEIADTYPDLTSMSAERLAAGHSGTAAAAAQPTFTIATAGWGVNQWAGGILTDSAGATFAIISNTSTVLTVTGTATPATGNGWTISVGGVIVANHALYAGAVSSTAFTAATFTDGAATWLVNQFVNHVLTDSAGATLRVASNTATVLTLQALSQGPNPTTGAYTITQGYIARSTYIVTGTQQVTGAPTGTGTANTFTPAAHVNWAAGMFGGMFLVDGAGQQWLITANSTTALTVASIGASTTPTSGSWSIVTVAGGSSLELYTLAQSVTVGALTAAAQTFSGSGISGGSAAAQLNAGALANVNIIVQGMTGTSTANVFTVTGGGLVTAAHTLAGMRFSDGVNDFLILDNSALTATTGTITVDGSPAATVTALGSVVQTLNNASAVTGTPAGTNGTSAVTGSLTASVTPTNPGSGEVLLVTLLLSDSQTQE